jgi:hypothetical protein
MLEVEHFGVFVKQVKQILNQTNKGRKPFNTRSFTYDASDGKTKVLFVYARARDGTDLRKQLLEWRLSKIYLDPTFLPVFIDGGGDEIVWIGVRPLDKGKRLEIEMAYDDEEKIESIRIAGNDENAIPYTGGQ